MVELPAMDVMVPPNIAYHPRRGCWEVISDFTIDIDNIKITIPAGFETDLATIPWAMRGLINTYELGLTAPIVHDYCYVQQGLIGADGRSICREQADRFFAALMFADGVAIWRIACAYYAVRECGRIWWRD
jgi:hypothetical protein